MSGTHSLQDMCRDLPRDRSEVLLCGGSTCKILAPNAGAEILGAPIGDVGFVGDYLREKTIKVGQVHAALRELERPAAELLLGRCCADVAKISHLLRTVGDIVPEEVTAAFDQQQRAFVEETLGGHVSEEAMMQATLGVAAGGLGLRSAQALARTAFVASRVESRPLVEDLLQRLYGLEDVAVRHAGVLPCTSA